MIQATCEIVEIPGGGLAALMPLADVPEKHWVAVEQGEGVLRGRRRVHRQQMAWRVANQPWNEGWKPMGARDVLLLEPDADFDLGGGD